MLRLRPSELCLTPDDVDETLRRMARKQALNSPRHVSAQPGRPMLRRGPQRAVRDAITTLGDIPILRPQPQQAVSTSVDEDLENGLERHPPSPPVRADSESGPVSPVQARPTSPGNVSTHATSALCSIHLPFRLSRSHGGSPTRSSTVEQNTEGATTSPRHTSPRHTSPRHTSPRSVEDTSGAIDRDDTGQRSPDTHLATSSSPAELRGGGRPGRDRADAFSGFQNMSPRSSRAHQVRSRAVPNDQEEPSSDVDPDATSSDEEHPTIHLRGFFTDPVTHPRGPAYWFTEVDGPTPRTEPRRPSGRLAMLTRSLSSSSAPAYPHPPRQPVNPFSDDLFDSSGYSPFSAAEARRFSSEASGTSAAYSIYDLPPESRLPSGERTGSAQHGYFQYDGSAASEHANRGAYHSVRPSDLRASNNPLQHPATSSAYGGQYGISPLPSMPYTRTQGNNAAPQPFSGTHMLDFAPTQYVDAATAAARNLNSPLEPFSDHYQRLTAMQNPRRNAPTQSPAYPPFESPDLSPPQHIGPRHNPTYGPHPHMLNNGRPQHSSAYRSPYHPVGALRTGPSRPSQTTGRDVQATRATQRSSENAPVRPPAHSSGPSRNSQVQIHRAAFERLHNAMQGGTSAAPRAPQSGPSRHSLPQSVALRSEPNEPLTHQAMRRIATFRAQRRQRTPQASQSPTQAREQPSSSQAGSSPPLILSRTSPGAPPRPPPPSNDPNLRGGGARRRITPTSHSPFLLHPSRNYASASIAPARASTTLILRSPLLRAATSARPLRRLPPQQRDQENSGAGEELLMRQEEAAINTRYGEDVQRDIMDETPPRVGRVERRMFS
jgi:hypothetical protein